MRPTKNVREAIAAAEEAIADLKLGNFEDAIRKLETALESASEALADPPMIEDEDEAA